MGVRMVVCREGGMEKNRAVFFLVRLGQAILFIWGKIIYSESHPPPPSKTKWLLPSVTVDARVQATERQGIVCL